MNDFQHKDFLRSNEIGIGLKDIWSQFVRYKILCWIVFFTIFLVGMVWVLLLPVKYSFNQSVEIGKIIGYKGEVSNVINVNDAASKLKEIFIPKAVRFYNLQAPSKIDTNAIRVIIPVNHDNRLLLSAMDTLSLVDVYKDIFQQVAGELINETKNDVELKVGIMQRKKKILKSVIDKQQVNTSMTRRVLGNTKTTSRTKKSGDRGILKIKTLVNNLQNSIDNSYNTRIVSEFTVSSKPISAPKTTLLFLITVTSFIFAFFMFFIVSFTLETVKCVRHDIY